MLALLRFWCLLLASLPLWAVPPSGVPAVRAEAWAEGEAEKAARQAIAHWSGLAAEVRSLPPRERKAFLLVVRGLVEVDANREVIPKLARGEQEALWALKVLTREQAHLSQLADDLGWPELAAYFRKEAADGARLIRGEIDLERYRHLGAINARNLDLIVAPYKADPFFVDKMMEHSERARPFASFIMNESKLFGSGE